MAEIDWPTHEVEEIDLDQAELLEVKPWKYPHEVGSGSILYKGQHYCFRISNEYQDGITYLVFDSNNVPWAYFSIDNDDPRGHC